MPGHFGKLQLFYRSRKFQRRQAHKRGKRELYQTQDDIGNDKERLADTFLAIIFRREDQDIQDINAD